MAAAAASASAVATDKADEGGTESRRRVRRCARKITISSHRQPQPPMEEADVLKETRRRVRARTEVTKKRYLRSSHAMHSSGASAK